MGDELRRALVLGLVELDADERTFGPAHGRRETAEGRDEQLRSRLRGEAAEDQQLGAAERDVVDIAFEAPRPDRQLAPPARRVPLMGAAIGRHLDGAELLRNVHVNAPSTTAAPPSDFGDPQIARPGTYYP